MASETAARTNERHFRGLGLHAERERDFTDVQALDLAQQQGGALRRRHAAEGLFELAPQLGLLAAIHRGGEIELELGLPRDRGLALARPQVVIAGVHGHAIEPGALVQRAWLAKPLEGLEKDVLRDILGVFTIAEKAEGEVVDARRMFSVQGGEGFPASVRLALLRTPHPLRLGRSSGTAHPYSRLHQRNAPPGQTLARCGRRRPTESGRRPQSAGVPQLAQAGLVSPWRGMVRVTHSTA
jgi:hypothetical protein